MQNEIDLSENNLLGRRAIAKIVAPFEPVLLPPSPCEDAWHVRKADDTAVIRCYGLGNNGNDAIARMLAAHIATNSPEVFIAYTDEILRLRSLEQEHEEYIANLEHEAKSTDNKIDGLAVLLGITPDTGNRRVIGIIKDEILRLQAEVARLEREADWLAQQFQNCPDEVEPEGEYWDICKMEDCAGVGKEDVAACWRRAARKRAEKKA